MARAHFDTRASIRTRYAGPTDTLGSRITASDDWPPSGEGSTRRRVTVSWDYGLDTPDNHHRAAVEWLACYRPGATIAGPGLAFGGDYFWTWDGGTDG